ncbi:hypothetical protein Bca101_051280 [Brassica carinata]
MSMNKSTSTAGKSSNPPPLNLVDYSDDEEQTTPQQLGSTRKKKNVKEERSKQSSEAIPEGADATMACKENRGKAIEVSSGESEEEDDLENTDSYEAEEVDAADVEPPISVKEKEKKRKAPSSATQSNPVRKSTRKTSASGIKTQAKAKTTSGEKRLAEQRYARFASREIIPECSVDLSSENTWGYLSIIKKGKLEKTVTGLGGYIPEILERKPREKLSPVIPYKKDARLGDIYLKNQKEEREAAKKAQRQAKKKGKTASTSTAAPPSRPPPSTPRSERTAPSGYVPPRQSPRAAGKFQIIHLGSIAVPGQPIDAEEAKLALDTTSEAIQQLATVMQTLTSVVGQIASMLFPRGEEETDDPQQQDDQGNFIMGEYLRDIQS